MASIEDILASKTDEELTRALKKGEDGLRLIDALEATEDFQNDGPFRASKAYENWSEADYSHRRQLLNLGISDVKREMARRNQDPRP